DIKVDPAEIVVTPGAKPIMFYTILALIEPQDEVLCPNPGYPIYESMVNFIGARAVSYPLSEANDFDLDVNEIISKITERTRLIVLNSPHNPTGGVLSRAGVQALAEALDSPHGRDIVVLADEIYSRLVFEGQHTSLTQFRGMKERTILLDGFSKTYAMTGWRLGYGVMPAPLARQVAQLMTNSNSCTASFTQIAGIAALRGDQGPVEAMRAEFLRRRQVIVDGLNTIPGFRCRKPRGAFYAYPNITGTGRNSRQLADALLNEAGVACLSGTAFGNWGEGYLRFSYANSVENIVKALDRIKAWTKKNL
ncbi:MAG TPA: aminotransferase class I/II-fold pyridoxal phosphate-dependent enzyme, partial [Terriglobia bacterium]|nr:aminotransferase class I/II-fold pyridoxal phosphate-dependent enzyme [Terriglobia bacterium]